MVKYKKSQRLIAIFFFLIFFPTIVPTNLFASNNGPKSPEASSFEPVDATDMVNLVTGQFSYVLPMLNIPSPEGGYPLAMGYHAGIAVDQEASWTGLGWNINPGAIDRGINGYPDDYKFAPICEYFYDSGGEEYQSFVSVSYSNGVSVGVGFNWGSNQALGGSVSIGYGFDYKGTKIGINATAGTANSSVNLGVHSSTGLSVGLAASADGSVNSSFGINNNGVGFSVGYGSYGNTFKANINNNIGFSLSSDGSHFGVSGGGVGMNSSFSSTVSMGDYTTNTASSNGSFSIPTPIGIFSLTFGKQVFRYHLNKQVHKQVFGPLKYDDDNYVVKYYNPNSQSSNITPLPGGGTMNSNGYIINGIEKFESLSEATYFANQLSITYPNYTIDFITTPSSSTQDGFTGFDERFFDMYEIPVDEQFISTPLNLERNNIALPSYDNYNVQAQGLSGNMNSTLFENGALFGLSNRFNDENFSTDYGSDIYSYSYDEMSNQLKFNDKPNFYFDNEVSTYLGATDVSSASFNITDIHSYYNMFNYYLDGVENNSKPRRRTSNFIEYYTNQQIVNTYEMVKQEGFLNPSVSGFDRRLMPRDGIGGFKITAKDGKTYHYSLPVYNHEILTRSFGSIPERPAESQAYFEKRQFEAYATHWLLTAVTGSDYVDNGNGVADDGDLGYWVSFDYGKWSDAFVWKAPYKKDYITDDENPNIKTWIRGRKQLYYLDKIKTRTHTALFIKSERIDSKSELFNYESVNQDDMPSAYVGPYVNRMTIPSQNQLKLNKIILVKNSDLNIDKAYGSDANLSVNIDYNSGYPHDDPGRRIYNGVIKGSYFCDNKIESAKYNIKDNVLDIEDNWEQNISKATKVIDFNYDYSLVKGDNRLTLKSVEFKGKSGISILPAYKFDYYNTNQSFNVDEMLEPWGYMKNDPSVWSLSRITTPQGATINVEYERNKCKSITDHKFDFNGDDLGSVFYDEHVNPSNNKLEFKAKSRFNCGITVGSILNVYYSKVINYGYGRDYLYTPKAVVTQDLGNNVYQMVSVGPIHTEMNSPTPSVVVNKFKGSFEINKYDFNINNNTYNLITNSILEGGGIRVSKIIISDGIDDYLTDYKYGNNEDGIGYVSYVPFKPNLSKEVPYSSELPPPRVLYEFVTVSSSHKQNVTADTKTRYKFNILKPRNQIVATTPINIKYGDFYEIEKTQNEFINNASGSSIGLPVSIGNYVIKNNLQSLGQLLEVEVVNSQGQLLNKMSNNYYTPSELATINNIGVKKESYQCYKEIRYIQGYGDTKWRINSSSRIKYPSLLKSSTVQKNGYKYITEFNDYDLISGIAKEQVFTTSDGKSFKTKIVPAYTKYSQMGSKVDNINNRNMLSQTAAEYSYIMDGGIWKETGVGITTWSNNWTYIDIGGYDSSPTVDKEKIWRKHQSYTWNGSKDVNGIFLSYDSTNGNDDGFVWSGVGVQPSQWKKISEVTLYDHYSMALEAKDINGNKASTKMGDNDTKVMAVGNAGYNEMFYSGGEYLKDNFWLDSEVRLLGGSLDNSKYHTGKNSIETTSVSQLGVLMRGGQHRAGKYRLTVWVHKLNASSARLRLEDNSTISFSVNEEVVAGDWVLKTAYFNVPTTGFFLYLNSVDNSEVYYDDLMIRPVASSVTGYVYDEFDQLTYIVNNNGLATQFLYYEDGTLKETHVEVLDDVANGVNGGFKRKTKHIKNYKNL